MSVPKTELKKRIEQHLLRWSIMPHRYQITYKTGRVIVKLITGAEVVSVEFSTSPQPLLYQQSLAKLDTAIRAGRERRQSDIEDNLVGVSVI